MFSQAADNTCLLRSHTNIEWKQSEFFNTVKQLTIPSLKSY